MKAQLIDSVPKIFFFKISLFSLGVRFKNFQINLEGRGSKA